MEGDIRSEDLFDDEDGEQLTDGETPYVPSDVLGKERDNVIAYLQSEILSVRDGDARKDMEDNWIRWRRHRRMRPEFAKKTTPWEGASNLVSTLSAEKVHAIYAKEIGAFALKKPPCTVSAVNPDDRELAESMTRFFTSLADNRYGLNMKKNLQSIFLDQSSLGTKFVKVPFLDEKWAFKKVDQMTGAEEQITYTKRLGPSIQLISMEDFFTQPYWKDIQQAPWIAVRSKMFLHELNMAVKIGAFDKNEVEKVKLRPISEYTDAEVAAQEARGVSVQLSGNDANKEYEIYECYVYWDTDGDGVAEDIRIFFEVETGAVLRSEFNPLTVRDVEPVLFMQDPDSLYGIGVCELVEQLQEEGTSLRNMRIDGTHLAMLKMFTKKTGAQTDRTSFKPFASIPVDEHDDIRQLEFSDPSSACLQGEMVAKENADRITGASDYMMGFNDKTVGSGASVGGTMFLAQQANSLLNAILQEVEQSITNIYQIVLHQCVANKERVDLSALSGRDQDNVRRVLSMGVEQIPTRFRFVVKATDINKTDESKKTDTLALAQIYAQYGQQILQLMGMTANPQIAQQPMMMETVQSLIVGATSFMGKVINVFDIGNPDDYLPFVDHLRIELKAKDNVRKEQVRQAEAILDEQTRGGSEISGGLAPTGIGSFANDGSGAGAFASNMSVAGDASGQSVLAQGPQLQ